MANALINFVVQEQIPGQILDYMVGLGMTESWQFLIVLNIFLLVLGMVMDGFSAILVAVPLVLPFAAKFHLNPFHMAVMFLLNLELAFLLPPLGLNLFISSFRFNRPVVSLYRVVMPFAGLVAVGLALVMYLPAISTVLLRGDVAAARAEAKRSGSPPREAWQLECVQEDHTHPMPCTPEEIAMYGNTYTSGAAAPTPSEPTGATEGAGTGGADDDLFRQMVGGAPSAAPAAGPASEDDLFRELIGAGTDDKPPGGQGTTVPTGTSDEDLFRMMVGTGADGGAR
jgi:C4-dicarboxylate transporter, DctM subunit